MTHFHTGIRAGIIVGAVSGLASMAAAQDSAPYAFVFGGAVLNGDLDTDGTIGGNPQTVDTDFDTVFQFGIGVGRSFPGLSSDSIGVRGEIELSFSDTDADQINFSGNGPNAEVNVDGGIRSTALFVNIYADFETNGAIKPFVGAGIGVGHLSQSLVYGPGVQVSESDTALGVQLIAGAAYEVSERVTLTADARYRTFFDVESNRFAPTGASTGVVSGDLGAFSVNFGARIRF